MCARMTSADNTAASQRYARSRSKTRGPVRAYEAFAVKKLLRAMGEPRVGLRLWDGSHFGAPESDVVGTIEIHHRRAFYHLLRQRELGFGDHYTAGGIDVSGDLVNVLTEIFSCKEKVASSSKTFLERLNKKRRANHTQAHAKHNIYHHYDVSNAFYRLWLDQEMQYTCAYFPDPNLTLEQAQEAKMDHISRKLFLKPGDRVIEAGCGWGGLARYMAVKYGAKVTAYNISREQVQYARERARSEGYDDSVTYIEDDYRNIRGECDAFVSVGMLEHVGQANYSVLGDVVDRVLTKNGHGLVHTIGRNQPRQMSAWIDQRIFPGAYPPTLQEMMDIFQGHAFSVLDVENLRLHYARTLTHWLARYEAANEVISEMFDNTFIRAWRLYLAGSVATFLSGALQLFQVAFVRGQNNRLPWSRQHLYTQ